MVLSGSLKTGLPDLGHGTPADSVYGVYGGLFRKDLNAMSAVEREDYLRALEFASPAFIEAILKAYRMGDQGAHHQGYAEIQSGSEKAPGNNLPDHGHIVNGSSSAET